MDICFTTSYFANLKNVASPLSISGKAPDWYTGPQYRALAPSWSIYSEYKEGRSDSTGYTERFMSEVLGRLDPNEVVQRIIELAGPNATLLCYEKPSDFCHRRLVASWLQDRLGLVIPELQNGRN